MLLSTRKCTILDVPWKVLMVLSSISSSCTQLFPVVKGNSTGQDEMILTEFTVHVSSLALLSLLVLDLSLFHNQVKWNTCTSGYGKAEKELNN